MDWYLLNILFIDHPPLAFLLHHSNTPNHHDRYHVQLMALCIVINNVRSFSNMDRIHCVIIHHLIIPTNGSSIIISSTCCRGSSIHRINHPSMPYQHLINHQTSNGTLSLQHIIWSVITIYHLTRPFSTVRSSAHRSLHPIIMSLFYVLSLLLVFIIHTIVTTGCYSTSLPSLLRSIAHASTSSSNVSDKSLL
jgi:hypothetical protein